MNENKKVNLFGNKGGQGKIPPQAVGLEEAVLGAILIEKECLFVVTGLLKPDDFYHEKHQRIYKSILGLHETGNPIDILTVVQKLRTTGDLEFVGGAFYIHELTSRVNSAANIESHARIISEYSIKRQLISLSNEVIQKCFDESEDAFACKEVLDSRLSKINSGIDGNKIRDTKSLATAVLTQIGNSMKNPSGITGVPSGYQSIDKITGGWQKSDLIIIAARPSMGKAQPLYSKVLTSNGFKLMGELDMGDKIAGADGKFYNLNGIYPQGEKEIFKVVFSDGTYAFACKEHLWYTETRSNRKAGKRGSIKTTEEIMNSLTTGGIDDRLNHSVPYCKPIEFSKKFLTLDPYLLGILLGDGSLGIKKLQFSNPEIDIINKVSDSLVGDKVVCGKDGLNHRIQSQIFGKISNTKRHLELLGLLNLKSDKKFVPYSYLHSTIEDRIQLLRGLCDSDGYVDRSNCTIEISSTSPRLREDIKFLAQSLGGRFTYSKHIGKYRKNGELHICKDYYRMLISFDKEIIPVSSVKHTSKFRARRKPHRKFIKEIIPFGSTQCQCISIDSPDHLYITDDFIVTHNTAFVVCNVLNAAIRYNTPVALFSLEMSAEQLFTRMLTSELDFLDLSTDQLRRGKITMIQYQDINKHIQPLIDSKIFIDDTPGLSLSKFKSKCYELKRKHDIQLIVVDYLQLMTVEGMKSGNREQEISTISRGLKVIAKELNVPVIALSQLSRAVETRGGDKRPQLSDLRESGAIEQDADVIGFLYRAEYYGITEDEAGMPTAGIGELLIKKHRNGALEDIILRFVSRKTKFYDPLDREPTSISDIHNFPDNASGFYF